MERCRNKDQVAWKQLVDNFANLVYSITAKYSLSEDDKGDVFQATFQSLYTNLDRIESVQALPRWIAVTASNHCLVVIRNRRDHVQMVNDERDLGEVLAAEGASAEEESVRASQAYAVRKALVELGGKCTELLQAIYLDENAGYEHAVKKLGLPMGSLGPTRARCLEKLKKILVGGGFFE